MISAPTTEVKKIYILFVAQITFHTIRADFFLHCKQNVYCKSVFLSLHSFNLVNSRLEAAKALLVNL